MATVKTREDTKADLFIGSREALVAAGIVCADQFPATGKLSVSYYSGVAKTTRGVIDENWLRIVAVTPGEVRTEGFRLGDWVVHKGVPQDVARTRYQAWLKRVHEEAANRKAREPKDAWGGEARAAVDRLKAAIGQVAPSPRPRAMLPEGWRVISGGRHA